MKRSDIIAQYMRDEFGLERPDKETEPAAWEAWQKDADAKKQWQSEQNRAKRQAGKFFDENGYWLEGKHVVVGARITREDDPELDYMMSLSKEKEAEAEAEANEGREDALEGVKDALEEFEVDESEEGMDRERHFN